MPESRSDRWQSHPVASALLRGAVFAIPVATSAFVSVVCARTLIPATGVAGLAWRWAVAFAISLVVLRITDRLARRLLPLAVLWKLSLAFPSEAPSRWKLARQAGNTRELEKIAEEARTHGIESEPARAAEHILTLVAAVEAHDRATRGHSERVRIFSELIAIEIGLEEDDRNKLRWAALLHDVGKLMVPAEVLNKPAKLDASEWDLIKGHPEQGMRFIEPLRAWLGEWALAVLEHHERYDGTGYPNGASGWGISRAARIVAVADAYEVMTARRPYRRPVKAADARAELVACSGAQFDPTMVRAFLQVSIGRLRVVAGPLSWLAQTPFLRGLEGVAAGTGAATTGGALVLGLLPVFPASPPADIERARLSAPAAASSETPLIERLVLSSPAASPTSSPDGVPSGDELPTPTPGPNDGKGSSPSPLPSPKPSPIATPTGGTSGGDGVGPHATPTGAPRPESSDDQLTPKRIGRIPVGDH